MRFKQMGKSFHLVFFLANILCSASFATEWIDCAGGSYWVSLLASPGEQGIVDYQITFNDKRQDTEQWALQEGTLDLTTGTLKARFEALNPTRQDLRLSANNEQGLLRVGARDANNICHILKPRATGTRP